MRNNEKVCMCIYKKSGKLPADINLSSKVFVTMGVTGVEMKYTNDESVKVFIERCYYV
jgi:hypothetical protein